MNATNTAAHRAGRLILAIADNDDAQTIALLREAADAPGGVLALVTAIASVAIESARAIAGDEWRSVLVTSLNALELSDD